jgi:hypothetical protein
MLLYCPHCKAFCTTPASGVFFHSKHKEKSMPNQKESYKEEIDRATAVFETNMGTFEAELLRQGVP